MKVDWFLFQRFPEMPLSVVDALLTEPLMLLKAEEVKANWNWNVKRKMLCSCETPGCSWSRGHGEGLWITATLLPAGQQLSRHFFFVKAITCFYHFKSEHFYHISFKLLPNALNYWNFCSTRKPGQGWLLSSLQRSRPSNFYQQSDNSSYWLLISMWQSFFCGSSVHCSVQVPECRKHNVFSVTPSRCRPPLHTGKKFHTNCATQWKVFTPSCPWSRWMLPNHI